MLLKGALVLLVLTTIANSGNVYSSSSYQFSNAGNGFGYSSTPGSLQYRSTPSTYSINIPFSYIPNGISSNTGIYGNIGGSTGIQTSAPIFVPQPLSGSTSTSSLQSGLLSSSSPFSSSYSSSSNQFSSSGSSTVPSDYTVLTQGQDSSSSLTGSMSVPASTSSTYSISGSISSGGTNYPNYSPSTTLGQISGVQSGAQVVSSSTASQVVTSQNNLIQGIPSSPNPIKY